MCMRLGVARSSLGHLYFVVNVGMNVCLCLHKDNGNMSSLHFTQKTNRKRVSIKKSDSLINAWHMIRFSINHMLEVAMKFCFQIFNNIYIISTFH